MVSDLPRPNRTLPVSEAASFLGVSAETLRRWDRRGILKPFRTKGGQRRYSLANLEAYKSGERSAKTPLKISQAAEQLGVHPETLRRWERDGSIKSQRTTGGQRRYSAQELEKISSPDSQESLPPLPTPAVATFPVAPPINQFPPKADQPQAETNQPVLPPLPPPQIPVQAAEQLPSRSSYRFLKLFAVAAMVLLAVGGWSQLSSLTKERLKRAFAPHVQVPIVDVNDAFQYRLSDSQQILGLKTLFPLEAPGVTSQTLTVLEDSVLNGARFLDTAFFGQ